MRVRLTALIFALVVVIVGGLGALISISEEQTLFTTQATALRSESRLAAQSLHREAVAPAPAGTPLSPTTQSPPATLTLPLRILVTRLTNANTGVVIWSASGQMLVTSGQVNALSGQATPSLVVPSRSTLRQVSSVAPADDAYAVVRDAQGRNQLVVLLPLVDTHTHAVVAVLQVSTPVQPIADAVSRTRAIVLVGVLIALALAAALTVPLVSAGLRPLATMERTSRRIASGDLSLRLEEPPTHDELGQLTRSFNTMVRQMESTITRQRQFVADVSHELRTPLTALNGELEMLLLGADRGNVEGVRRLARGMHAEIGRLGRLVEDLLTLAQFDEGQAELTLQPTDVERLIEQVAAHGRALASGQRIDTEVAPDLPSITADADRLQQALLNLLENALKYTPADGRIRLVARLADDGAASSLLVQVADTGSGVAAEALPHIFDRFYRADVARKRGNGRPTGAGLGLSIVKSLIEAQGGLVTISSELGRGTTVTLAFPVASEPRAVSVARLP
jgi:two-component system OmpR family sensor kinase